MTNIDINQNRKGYKKTNAGWIPKDWNICSFSDALNRTGTPVDIDPEAEYREIGIRSHGKGIFHKEPTTGSALGNKRVFHLEAGCLMFNIVFAWEQAVAVSSKEEEGLIASHRFPMYQSKSGWDVDFIAYYLKTTRGKYSLGIASPGGAGRNRTLGQSELDFLMLPQPPEKEQHRIKEILLVCDSNIDQVAALIEAEKNQLKALMQKLLTGEKRLQGFNKKWKKVTLNEICHRIKTGAKPSEHHPVLSISSRTGFVSQEDKFSRVIAGKQVDKYILIEKGDFSYNKGNSKTYPQGCVFQLSEYDTGLVPNVFYSFRLKTEQADASFIKYYFRAGRHNQNLYKWINTGARNDGLLNLNASDFFKLPILLPPLSEQKKIGEILATADTRINQLGAKLKSLKEQKAALAQKLLTGQIRVKI